MRSSGRGASSRDSKWKSDLGEKKRRQTAEEVLAKVTDPRAVPAIVRVFAGGSPDEQSRAVSLLKGIESAAASRELSRLAVVSQAAPVREARSRH